MILGRIHRLFVLHLSILRLDYVSITSLSITNLKNKKNSLSLSLLYEIHTRFQNIDSIPYLFFAPKFSLSLSLKKKKKVSFDFEFRISHNSFIRRGPCIDYSLSLLSLSLSLSGGVNYFVKKKYLLDTPCTTQV